MQNSNLSARVAQPFCLLRRVMRLPGQSASTLNLRRRADTAIGCLPRDTKSARTPGKYAITRNSTRRRAATQSWRIQYAAGERQRARPATFTAASPNRSDDAALRVGGRWPSRSAGTMALTVAVRIGSCCLASASLRLDHCHQFFQCGPTDPTPAGDGEGEVADSEALMHPRNSFGRHFNWTGEQGCHRP
jgi:hypothetical protein